MSKGKLKFWKPGDVGPGESLKEERSSSYETSSSAAVFNANSSMSIQQQRQRLPIFQMRNHILYMLEKFRTLVIIGETGCGKSTQIPQYLIEGGWAAQGHVIGVTQPRRVAVVTVAKRVAEERGAILGEEVGYAIRFDDCWDPTSTRVKFMTDGLLVREMMQDPLLSRYSVLMLDEAHERTLHTDIVIGLLKKIQKKRPELKVIVASATLDAERFRQFFEFNASGDEAQDTAAILTVEGRMFPVDVLYTSQPVPDYVKATVETVMKIHLKEPPGDVLAFLTGQEEVQQVVSLLIDEARNLRGKDTMKMRVLPMHGSLPSSEQMKVFERVGKGTRKIIIATNIAEASITINGIVYVVDCGFVKINAFNPMSGVETLVIIPLSQASAQQRAGRAGRVRSGKAFRLYTEEAFNQLPQSLVPEMQRTDMATVILQLKALGIDNILRFNFLSPPPAQNMVHGLELLFALGALNDVCQLVDPLGLQMAEFPLHPMYAKFLLVSSEFKCSEEAVIIAAMMQIQNVFVTPSNQKNPSRKAKRLFSVEEGDHLTMLNVFRAFIQFKQNKQWCHEHFLNYKGLCRAIEIRNQLTNLLKRFHIKLESCGDDVKAVRRCITAAFFANAARYHYSGEYRTVKEDHTLHVHPTSVLYTEKPPSWIIYNEVVHTSREFMRDVTVIEPEWLYELAPHYYEFGTARELAAKRARLT